MDRNPEYGRPLVGSGFKPLHLLCCLVWSSNSLIGWRGLVYAVIRRFQGSFEVDCTKSTLWKQNPRTFPLPCVHCFAWKPKLFPQQLLIWMCFWWMLESPSRSCVLYSWALNALAGVFQWECVIRFFGVWFLSDSSSGVRSRTSREMDSQLKYIRLHETNSLLRLLPQQSRYVGDVRGCQGTKTGSTWHPVPLLS